MIPAAEAWQLVLRHARALPTTPLPLSQCRGRILRVDVRADADSPPFDASAMDGYAFRAPDAGGVLRVVGTSQAGGPFPGSLGAGECVRIFTGAPVPAGADAIVKQEDTARDGDGVRITNRDAGFSFIRRRGENRRAGELVVPAGTRLGPPELAALAGVGQTEVPAAPAPRCAHLVTGDELVAPETAPRDGQIRDSNSTLVAALLAENGATLVGQKRVPDTLPEAQAGAAALPDHDVLLLSGGASVGDRDLARPLLEALGYQLHFDAVNLRPGKPLTFASRGARLAFALPGNPVSHWVVFHLFVAPLLAYLQTGAPVPPTRRRGRLARGAWLPAPNARQTFWPCRSTFAGDVFELTPLPLASSGDGAGLVGANALLPLPAGAAKFDDSQMVEFIPCP